MMMSLKLASGTQEVRETRGRTVAKEAKKKPSSSNDLLEHDPLAAAFCVAQFSPVRYTKTLWVQTFWSQLTFWGERSESYSRFLPQTPLWNVFIN